MRLFIFLGAAFGIGLLSGPAFAAVSVSEAAKLKTDLTPLGGEKAGNADGSIPAWSGGLTSAPADFIQNGVRKDPFAAEKPLFSISVANVEQYKDKLSGAVVTLLKNNPEQRLDVYPTHRTAAAPQWVYDNTFANAASAGQRTGGAGMIPENVIGGIPFPIPKSAEEIMWNHKLRWRGTSWHWYPLGYLTTSADQKVLINDSENDHLMPYYIKGISYTEFQNKYHGDYWVAYSVNAGPPIRAGEAIMARTNIDEDLTSTWVYLTGQRRVRKLPNASYDTPTPFSAGVSTFDEIDVFYGRLERFDWKIIGKQEMYLPYNTNKASFASVNDALGKGFLNPDNLRWELHRVWVVESNLKPTARHTSPKSRYYIDEDTWIAALADRWDGKGQLWRGLTNLIFAAPDIPATTNISWGYSDLLSGTWYMNGMTNERPMQYENKVPPFGDEHFTPDQLAAMGVR